MVKARPRGPVGSGTVTSGAVLGADTGCAATGVTATGAGGMGSGCGARTAEVVGAGTPGKGNQCVVRSSAKAGNEILPGACRHRDRQSTVFPFTHAVARACGSSLGTAEAIAAPLR